jgi:hypothetical protein
LTSVIDSLQQDTLTGKSLAKSGEQPRKFSKIVQEEDLRAILVHQEERMKGKQMVVWKENKILKQSFFAKPESMCLNRNLCFVVGSISWGVYSEYVHAGGLALFTAVVVFYVVGLGSHAGGDFWISVWTTNKLS